MAAGAVRLTVVLRFIRDAPAALSAGEGAVRLRDRFARSVIAGVVGGGIRAAVLGVVMLHARFDIHPAAGAGPALAAVVPVGLAHGVAGVGLPGVGRHRAVGGERVQRHAAVADPPHQAADQLLRQLRVAGAHLEAVAIIPFHEAHPALMNLIRRWSPGLLPVRLIRSYRHAADVLLYAAGIGNAGGRHLPRCQGKLKLPWRRAIVGHNAVDIGPPEGAVLVPRRPAGQHILHPPCQVVGQHILPTQQGCDVLLGQLPLHRAGGDIPVQGHFHTLLLTILDIGQHIVGRRSVLGHLVATQGPYTRLRRISGLLQGDVGPACWLHAQLRGRGGHKAGRQLAASPPQAAHQRQRRSQRGVFYPRHGTFSRPLQLRQPSVEGAGHLHMIHIVFILPHVSLLLLHQINTAAKRPSPG